MSPPTSKLSLISPTQPRLYNSPRPQHTHAAKMDTNSQSQPLEETAILFQNETKSVFLIDIPHSIALAQDLPAPKPTADQDTTSPPKDKPTSCQSSPSGRKQLLSTPPRKAPYPSSNEPKKAAARAKVLENIPPSDRILHGNFIQPLVNMALQEIGDRSPTGQGLWCLPRYVIDNDEEDGSGPRKRKSESLRDDKSFEDHVSLFTTKNPHGSFQTTPPLILSSTSTNKFASISDLRGIIKNPSSDPAVLSIGSSQVTNASEVCEYLVPPKSSFVQCTLPLASAAPLEDPIPGIPPSQKFNLILFDPPWPNRSVRRSGHYETYNYTEMDTLTQRLQDILRVHAYCPSSEPSGETSTRDRQTESQESIAAIWITNSRSSRRAAYEAILTAGFQVCEEWIWIKTTVDGQPVSPVDGLWKRPYEILVIGRRVASSKHVPVIPSDYSLQPETNFMGVDPASVKRRVIAAVPDLHSRKPCLKDLFERVFCSAQAPETSLVCESYTALEVFARNLTAGWWACGNEVLKFNDRKCWQEPQV